MTQYIYEWDCQTDIVKDTFHNISISCKTLLDKKTLFYYVTEYGIPSHIRINHIVKNQLIFMKKHLKKTFV